VSLIVTETAAMQCDKGAAPAKLIVTSQTFVRADEKLVATEMDYQPMLNIPPFGVCSVTQKACIPATQQWTEPRSKDTVGGSKKLTDASTCRCSIGGTIRFLDSGHSGFVSAKD